MKKPQNGIAYVRFSPRRDADDCESCDHQLTRLREYAGAHNITIAGREFRDDAVSGKVAIEDRELHKAMQACRRDYVLLVCAFDRLFRDSLGAAIFRAKLRQKKITLLSITTPAINDETPVGKLIGDILFALSEFERKQTAARTKDAMLAHQKNGRRMSARVPWGTQRDPDDSKRLVPHDGERAIIDEIVALRKDGLGLRAIGRKLEDRGRARRGKTTWPHQIVGRILAREGLLSSPVPT